LESSLLSALFQVVIVNVVLSGDNAVVIGLAARTLAPAQQRRAIVLGAAAAVLLRLALTIPAALLLDLPLVRAGGGLLLAWVAYRLLVNEVEVSEGGTAASVASAVGLILVADVSMSLDNVLAVAAIAQSSPRSDVVLAIGLGLSIPLVLLGGSIVAALMTRLPWLAWVGAAVLTFTAAGLIADDTGVQRYAVLPEVVRLSFETLLTAAVLGGAWWSIKRAEARRDDRSLRSQG
jgi:YjbE family integral membrane protein